MTTIAVIQKAETETGQTQSFERIIAENESRIFNTIYSFVGNYEDALDLTQDTFIYAFRNMQKFRRESSVSTWLYTIAINVCKKNYNMKKRHGSVFIDSIDDPKTAVYLINFESQDQSASEILELNEEQRDRCK